MVDFLVVDLRRTFLEETRLEAKTLGPLRVGEMRMPFCDILYGLTEESLVNDIMKNGMVTVILSCSFLPENPYPCI